MPQSSQSDSTPLDENGKQPLQELLKSKSKYKERSHQTHIETHVPVFTSLIEDQTRPKAKIQTILLGDSMLERLKTTCNFPSFGAFPLDDFLSLETSSFSSSNGTETPQEVHPREKCFELLKHTLNLGVGGDTFQNIAYRLTGDAERQVPGLLDLILKQQELQGEDVRLFILMAGTNNLHKKRGLRDGDVEVCRFILRAVLGLSEDFKDNGEEERTGKGKGSEGQKRIRSRVLVHGLFYRKDVDDGVVDDANMKIRDMVGDLNDETEHEDAWRIRYVCPSDRITKDGLVDHVHLGLEAYREWIRDLMSEVESALE